MKLKDYTCFLLIILTVLLASCSVQKRHYRQGYYIENKGKEQTSNKNTKDSSIVSSVDSSQKKNVSFNKNSSYKHDCDTLSLNDGTTLICKIEEVSKRSVRFKDCPDSTQLSNSIDAELVSVIKFYNGRVKTISKKEDSNRQNKPKDNNTLIKGSLVDKGLILAILGLLLEIVILLAVFHIIAIASYLVIVLAVLNALVATIAIVFGFSSLKEIRKSPEIFKGKKLATWDVILGLLSLVSWLVILIAITIV
jgi:hypothetical protein